MGCMDPYESSTHSPQHDRAPWGGSSSTPTIIIQSVFQSSYNLNLETYFYLIIIRLNYCVVFSHINACDWKTLTKWEQAATSQSCT